MNATDVSNVMGLLDEALKHIVDAAGVYDEDSTGQSMPDLVLAMGAVRASQRELEDIARRVLGAEAQP